MKLQDVTTDEIGFAEIVRAATTMLRYRKAAPEELRAGFAADIVAVRGDPLASLDVLRAPALVQLGGEVVGGTDAAVSTEVAGLPRASLPTH